MAGIPGGGFSMGMGMGMPSMMPSAPAPTMMAPMMGASMAGPMAAPMAPPAPMMAPNAGMFEGGGSGSMPKFQPIDSGYTPPTPQAPPTGSMWADAQLNSIKPVGQPLSEMSSANRTSSLARGEIANNMAIQTADRLAPGGITPDIQATQPFAQPDASGWKTPVSETAKNPNMQQRVIDSFMRNGLTQNQAEILSATIGREGDVLPDKIFGVHTDAANQKTNIGMMSWQGSRGTALKAEMSRQGLLKPDGTMIQSDAAIDAQTKFLLNEMRTNPMYADTKTAFLDNPNPTYEGTKGVFQKNFVRWNPRVAKTGWNRESAHYKAALGLRNKSSFPSVTQASAPLPKAAHTTVGSAISQALFTKYASSGASAELPQVPLPTPARWHET